MDDAPEDVGGVFVGVVMDDGLEVPEVGGGASGGGVSTNLHPRRPHKVERERERELTPSTDRFSCIFL